MVYCGKSDSYPEVKRVMAAEFSGNFAHTVDAKGRITIPAAYRDALGEGFTIGMNSKFTAVALYPRAKWEKISDDLSRIPDTDAEGMRYVRLINGNSFAGCDLDGQGRVLIPPTLRQKAALAKEIRFVGIGQYLEVWDENRYLAESEAAENDEQLLDYVNSTYFKPYNANATRRAGGQDE